MPEVIPPADPRPLILHVVHRFDYGGLENGLVNVINGLPERFRHAIVALTQASSFAGRIRRPDVAVHTLDKRPGQDPATWLRLFRLCRSLRPAIVHTRNLGTIEASAVARAAGVSRCIHGEHGWDTHDPQGLNRRYRLLRRALSPAIERFVAVSDELEQWLLNAVGIARRKVVRICNGVDTQRFSPQAGGGRPLLQAAGFPAGSVVVGSVTRFNAIKDPLNLVRAFIAARGAPAGADLRLVMAGDGPLRAEAQQLLGAAGLARDAWLPGSRDDVAQLLREMDLFVLGSLREGISNTILEAMASGLPVIASATGGNFELVQPGVTGELLPAADTSALAACLLRYAAEPQLRRAQAQAARARVEQRYSLARMIYDYQRLYEGKDLAVGEAA